MKAVVIALVVLIASVSAWPQGKFSAVSTNNERLVADIIVSLVEDFSLAIKNRGLDPYYLNYIEADYALPVPSIFSASASAESVALDGLSNIVINDVGFNFLTGVLTFDISLPELSGSVGNAAARVSTFGHVLSGEGSGSLKITLLRVSGSTEVSVNIISGIFLDELKVNLTVEDINSNIYLNLFGYDISEELNIFLGDTLVESLDVYNTQISELIQYIFLMIVNDLL